MIGIAVTVKNGKAVGEWAGKLPTEFNRRATLLVGSYALRIEREAKQAVPVRSSILRSSIHTQILSTGKRTAAKVGTDVKYGPYVEYGTGLFGYKHAKYEIKPRFKKALAWATPAGFQLTRGGGIGAALYRRAGKGGKISSRLVKSASLSADRVVRRRVMHPGVHPRPYLIPAFDRRLPEFQRDLGELLKLASAGFPKG